MKSRDIIITGLQSWDIQIGSNCKNLALEFSRHNRVLYVDPPRGRIAAIKKPKRRKKGLVRVNEKLWVYYPRVIMEPVSRLPFNVLFDLVNRYNNKRFAKEIKVVSEHLAFSDFIHFCDSDIFRSYHLKELLNPALYIYYSRDNLQAVKFWQPQGSRIEPLHMAKADMVVANSQYLSRRASRYNSQSHFVGQGCDLEAFTSMTELRRPFDMENIRGPVIGYLGALNSLRLDPDLLLHIATSRNNWNLVLVGPEDEKFKSSQLHRCENVYFLGSKSQEELPRYVKYFDVAINPQMVNEVTIGNYPRKIDEYLAAGKRVVATNTTAMEYFEKHVLLAETEEEWIQCIEEALQADSPAQKSERISFASTHSWKNNAGQIYACINNHSKQ